MFELLHQTQKIVTSFKDENGPDDKMKTAGTKTNLRFMSVSIIIEE
jgi:hypothetical protein